MPILGPGPPPEGGAAAEVVAASADAPLPSIKVPEVPVVNGCRDVPDTDGWTLSSRRSAAVINDMGESLFEQNRVKHAAAAWLHPPQPRKQIAHRPRAVARCLLLRCSP